MKRYSKNYYNKNYFKKRDFLDLHLAEMINILMNENRLKSILDVGCGTGRLVKFLKEAGYEVKGCDLSTEAVRFAQKLVPGQISQARARKLPFKNNSFDIITSISVIEHLNKKEAHKFFNEAKRVLKSKGILFLVTPNFATPIRYFQGKKWFGYSDPTHIVFYTPKSLSQLLKKYGFENTKLWFKTKYSKTFDWEFPSFFSKLPKYVKKILIYLLFSSPLCLIRNSFWISAHKK